MAVVFKSPERTARAGLLDRAGICVSAVCLVQCLVLSLAIVLAPMMSLGIFGSDLFHRLLLLLILPLSVGAFWLGYRSHGSLGLLLAGLSGLALVLAAAFLEATVLPPLAASALTSAGGVTLIVGHWLNLRRRRSVCLRPAE
ncbi:MAG: MerC family mercury resistance protein [Gammaproteobacteria bacterium]|jgi:hypothetical protein|nr:MerC family mercury resistance protein [Gammaproteobacteria bacterium]